MSRTKKLLLGVAIAVGLFTLGSTGVDAAEIRTKDMTVEQDETVNDDLYIFGDKVEVAGTVTGDLITSGDEVTISGYVSGDVYASGGIIDITGNVGGSVFVAGGQIDIDCIIGENLYMAGGQLTISTTSNIQEDVFIGGGQVEIDGIIGDDLRAGVGTMSVNAQVGGDVLASGGQVDVDEDKVEGDVEISVTPDEGALKDIEKKAKQDKTFTQRLFSFNTLLTIASWIGMYIVGALLIRLVPVKTQNIVKKITGSWSEFGMSVVIGLVGFIVMIFGPLLIAFTLIGIPLAILLIGVSVFLAAFGILWGDMALGNVVLNGLGRKDKQLYLSLLVGRVIRAAVTWIPCIGGLYGFIMLLATIGGFVRMKMDLMKGTKGTTKKGKK